MASALRKQIEEISRENNINPDVIIAAIEDAILTAAKNYYNTGEDLRSRFNGETGEIEVFAVKEIVGWVENEATQIDLAEARKLIPEAELGQAIEFPKDTTVLGRIAAQTAKQVIFQKVREAARDDVFDEYSKQVGEVVNGIIKRQELRDFIVDLGRVEALLPGNEQSRAETYLPGDRIRVAIVRVLKAAVGPQVIVSRRDPALLVKLFEMGVPEIHDGRVQIRGCVREAGERAKVAVVARERDVDPLNACRGKDGNRVQPIIEELHGEKIDIVEWSDDPLRLLERALSPAQASRVTIVDHEQKIMEVVVADKQLSIAIGKKGQNVRLAAKLVGWHIDIKSEEEKRQEVEAEMAHMMRVIEELKGLEVEGVSEKVVQKLIDAGIQGLAQILELTDVELEAIVGGGPITVAGIRHAANQRKPHPGSRDAKELMHLGAGRSAPDASEGSSPRDANARPDSGRRMPVAAVGALLADRYHLRKKLGEGGMGTVFVASDEFLGRDVAVKCIRPELAAHNLANRRFSREVRVLARLSHPNIVAIYDGGFDGGIPFFVMELLSGRSLREELLACGTIQARRTRDVANAIAGALQVAHAQGIIHRDLKPENIFLSRIADGREAPKILDFGVAKALDPEGHESSSRADGLTGVGFAPGTPVYMAPEQLLGEKADPRWDLWALAVISYEMLFGGHPFSPRQGSSWLRDALAGRFARPSEIVGATPGLDHFFECAFSPDPDLRPATGADFMVRFRTALGD